MVLNCFCEKDICKNMQSNFPKTVDRRKQNGIIIFVSNTRKCVDEDSSPFLTATERDARGFRTSWVEASC